MQRDQSRRAELKRNQSSRVVHDPLNPNFIAYFPGASERRVNDWKSQRLSSRKSVQYVMPPPAALRSAQSQKSVRGPPMGPPMTSSQVVKHDRMHADPDEILPRHKASRSLQLPSKECVEKTAKQIRDPYTHDTFDQQQHLSPLTHIGHTRPKGRLFGIENVVGRAFQYDAGFVAAPQNYRSDAEYKKFPGKPRQQQLSFAGNNLMPVPCGPRTFYENESKDITKLNQTVYCRGFHCDQKDIQWQLEKQYWPKGRRQYTDPRGETWSNWARRMASSFAGGKIGKQFSMWVPRGETQAVNAAIRAPPQLNPSFDQALYEQGFSGETMQRLRQQQ